MQNRRLRRIAVAVGVVFVHWCGLAFAESYTLMDLYGKAVAKDTKLGQATAYRDASNADQSLALSALLPKVSMNAMQRTINHSVDNYSSTNLDGNYQGSSLNLSGQLPLLNPSLFLQLSAAGAGVRGAEASLFQAHQDLMVRLSKGYLQLLKATVDAGIYQDDIARLQKIHEQARAALQAGTGDIIAVYEAKARVESARADAIRAQSVKRLACQELSSLTGVPITTIADINLSDAIHHTTDTIEWWVSEGHKHNHSVIQAREELEQATFTVKANKATHLPTLQLISGYSYEKGSTFIPELITRQWYAGVSLSVPIYSGGETVARTERAVAGETERRFLYASARDQVQKAVEEAYLNLEYNVNLIQAYKEKLEATTMQLTAVRKGYSIGTRTILDQLNAEQAWSVSKRDYDTARYDNLLRWLELRAASGTLAVADLLEIKTVAP